MKKKHKSLAIDELFWSTAYQPGFFESQESIPLIILGVSCIDQHLRTLLAGFFVECNTAEGLLDFNRGHLGSFQARANIAYALGLIPKTVFQNICILAEIRNKIAHHHEKLSFDDDDMKILIDGDLKGESKKQGLYVSDDYTIDLEYKTDNKTDGPPRLWVKTDFASNLSRKEKFCRIVKFCIRVISNILLNRVPLQRRIAMKEAQEKL